ncbi:cytochrome c biogenesis protein [Spirochaetia bacterium]|nr:cytochrome c biogenesis protein [Spirochaetia bacterium]
MKNRSKFRLGEFLVPYFFITPFMVSFIAFFLVPAVYSLVLSFFQYKGYGAMRFLGVRNYISLFTYRTFWFSLRNTFFYFIVHTIPTMILAFTWAFMLQSKLMSTAQRVFKPVLFLPQVVPIIASALIWRILLARDFGAVNQIMGTSIDFLRDTSIRKWAVVVLMIWRATGWYMIIYLAGLTTIGDEIYDAAKIDGANAFQRIFRVVLPMMKPIILFAFIMNAIGSIKVYTEPDVLLTMSTASVQPDAMGVMHVLLMNLRGANFGMAAAVGWIVFILASLMTLGWFKVLGNKGD